MFDADTYQAPKSKINPNQLASEIINSIDVTKLTNTAYTDATRYVPVTTSLKPVYQNT